MLNPVRKKKNNKIIIFAIITLLLISGGVGYYFLFTPEKAPEIIYQTGKVRQDDLLISLENSGVIKYLDENEIISTVNGTVSYLYVQENSNIKIGDPILAVDDSNLKIQLEQAYNDLKIAKLKLADLLQTTIDKINDVTVEQLVTITAPIDGVAEYSVQNGMYVSNNSSVMTITDNQKLNFIGGVPLALKESIEVGQNVQIDTYDLSNSLTGTITKISNTAHSNGYEMIYDVWITVENTGIRKGMTGVAEFQVDINKFKISGEFDNLAETAIYPTVSGKIETIYIDSGEFVAKGTPLLKIDSTSLINQVETQKQSIRNTELKIEQLMLELESVLIKSPNEGAVIDLYVTQNQAINSNTKIAKIVTDLVTSLEIDELDIGKVELGQEVLLLIPGFSNDEVKGIVSYISDSGLVKDGITTYEVYISFAPNAKIKPGMTVDATIILDKAENVLMVPTTSIIDVKDGKAVRVLVDEQIKVKKVEVGITNDIMTQITSGIEMTDIIITSLTIPESSTTSTSGSSSLVPSNVSIPGITGGAGGGGSGK